MIGTTNLKISSGSNDFGVKYARFSVEYINKKYVKVNPVVKIVSSIKVNPNTNAPMKNINGNPIAIIVLDIHADFNVILKTKCITDYLKLINKT